MTRVQRLGLVGAGIALVADVVYLTLLSRQGTGDVPTARTPFLVAFIATMGVVAGAGSAPRLERLRPLLFAASAIGLAFLGVLAIFSIGLLLLAAAVPLVLAEASILAPARRSAVIRALAGAVAASAIVVAGIDLTELPLGCPATGYQGGSGSGLISGPYHWTCANGRLTVGRSQCSSAGASFDAAGNVISTTGC